MSHILIIYTGGTIGMMHDSKTKSLRPFDFGKIVKHLPEIDRLNCKTDFFSFDPVIDSSDMKPELWTALAKQIEKNYSKYDGFVILHGTDTMAYTSSALSFMLENLGKPVILTGSQLPVGAIRTDAKRNLITSIEIASLKKNGKPVVNEVCVFFSNQLFRGNRIEKYASAKFDAFQSINYPLLAEAGVRIDFNHDALAKISNGKFKVHASLDTNISLLKIFPGISFHFVESVLSAKNLKAVVLETYGSGNAPTDKWFIGLLKKAIDNDIVILNVSQCSGGRVEMGKYETSRKLKEIGVISGGDMTTEAAVTKLMFLLGQKISKTSLLKKLCTPLAGEMDEDWIVSVED